MPIGIGFSSGDGMDAVILPAGQHACKLISVTITEGLDFDKTETIQQIRWTFEAVQWASPDGKPGIISQWTRLNYGSPKAKLTALLDSFFGRSLTQSEAGSLDMEKMNGVIKGYVMVVPHRKTDNTMTTKFAAFIPQKNAAAPNPVQFYRDGASTAAPVAAASARPSAASEVDTDDMEDPFAE